MLIINEKSGNLVTACVGNRYIDKIMIEWYETRKRILHKQTMQGESVAIRFLNENPDFKDGDILYMDETKIIAIEINPCKCIVVAPGDILTAASLCYEIGNRHLPLYYEGEDLLVPYEIPLHNLLEASGYQVRVEQRKLNNSIRTSVMPHLQVGGTGSQPFQTFTLSTS